MKIDKLVFAKLFTVFVVVSALAFISGCRPFDRGEVSPALAVPTSISGRVVKTGASASQRDSERPLILAADSF